MRIIILFNPAAGRGSAGRKLARAVEVLRRGGVEPEIRESRSAAHLCELARQALDERPNLVVSAGGDGTHHHVLNVLRGSDVSLGMIPLGTGNDLPAGLGLPSDPRRAAEIILNGKTQRIDLGGVGSKAYGGMAGTGLDSMVARYVNERAQKIRGRSAYAWGILCCLIDFQPQPLEIEAEGFQFSGDVIAVLVGNLSLYGGGFRITPRARPDDGLLDVCLVPAMSKLQLLRWIPRIYRGTHLAHQRIQYFQTPQLTLCSPSKLDLYADGEFVQPLPVTIEALPKTLSVIVP
ncbi:MAG: diacylglycerol kinase family protein [Terriglobia bacterium]